MKRVRVRRGEGTGGVGRTKMSGDREVAGCCRLSPPSITSKVLALLICTLAPREKLCRKDRQVPRDRAFSTAPG